MDEPFTLLEFFDVEPCTPRWNALRGFADAARAFLQHHGHPDEHVHRAGLVRAGEFFDSFARP